MEFKFSIQEYQTHAADSVARVFDGQPKPAVSSELWRSGR